MYVDQLMTWQLSYSCDVDFIYEPSLTRNN